VASNPEIVAGIRPAGSRGRRPVASSLRDEGCDGVGLYNADGASGSGKRRRKYRRDNRRRGRGRPVGTNMNVGIEALRTNCRERRLGGSLVRNEGLDDVGLRNAAGNSRTADCRYRHRHRRRRRS
jgi:hypothetical protein